MKKMYGVCISDYVSQNGFMFCECENKTTARAAGNLYRRQWEIKEQIIKIVEIPENIKNDDNARRDYAVSA